MQLPKFNSNLSFSLIATFDRLATVSSTVRTQLSYSRQKLLKYIEHCAFLHLTDISSMTWIRIYQLSARNIKYEIKTMSKLLISACWIAKDYSHLYVTKFWISWVNLVNRGVFKNAIKLSNVFNYRLLIHVVVNRISSVRFREKKTYNWFILLIETLPNRKNNCQFNLKIKLKKKILWK